jgi:glycine cleavage system T protein (aminomethyltransferase)
MPDRVGKTPLHDWHTSHGANMLDFHGWEMPLWYRTGAVAEHRAVITNAGIFDTSHMSVVMVQGRGAFGLLQLCFTRDLTSCVGYASSALEPGECVFGAFLNERGEAIDDCVLFQLDHQMYMAVVNAGKGETIAAHLRTHSSNSGTDIADYTGRIGKLDVQGIVAAKVFGKILRNPGPILANMGYFTFRGRFDSESPFADTFLTDGTPIMLSRTGYTGEFGFELFVDPDHLVHVWETILSAGEEFGLIPCGLAARDSLRAGAVLPLSGQDFGPWPFINHPWPFALPYDRDGAAFTKKFLGDIILEVKDSAEHTYPFVGYDPRKVSIQDPAVVLDSTGNEIGVVLTCVADMAMGRDRDRVYSMASPDKPADFTPKGLSCGFVRVRSKLEIGQQVELKDSKRAIEVMIVDDVRPNRTARTHIRDIM